MSGTRDGKTYSTPQQVAERREKVAALTAEGMSAAEIAELLGIHRVTVSNALGLFRRAGLIDETDHGLTLTDAEALSACVADPQLLNPQL